MAKKVQLASISDTEKAVSEQLVVTFQWGDDKESRYDLKELFPAGEQALSLPFIVQCLLVHGFKQKGPDAYAKRGITPPEAREALDGVWDALRAEQWTRRRTGGGEATPMAKLAQAIVNAWAERGVEKDYDAVLAGLEAKTKEERAAIRKVPQVAVELAKLGADADQDLEGLDV